VIPTPPATAPAHIRSITIATSPRTSGEVVVRAGQTLTSIARQEGLSSWHSLYSANAAHVRDPDLIFPGEVLRLHGHEVPMRGSYRMLSGLPPEVPPSAPAAPAEPTAPASAVSLGDYSGVQQCIVERESGGNPQVMNASGHYGLYQFDLGTWEEGGGSAATFGDASVAEQNAVFSLVFSQRGVEPWQPSDGC
jgi:LysM repeat protein